MIGQISGVRGSLAWLVASVVFGATLFFSGVVGAVTLGGGEVQRYHADRSLDYGTVVALDQVAPNADRVAPASPKNLGQMFGVVIDPAQLPVIASKGKSKEEVFVASSGTYSTLVSSQNGVITAGDYVTLSAVDGVLMKADTKQSTVFGRAAKGFDENSVTAGTVTLQDDQGGSTKVRLGLVPVTVDIKENPNQESTKSKLPEFLEDIGQQIAKKEVSPIRIYLSMAITAISLITAIVVLYAGVRNSVISIGRNPMSKKSIFRALLEIILTSIAVLMVGLFAVYLLLRL